MTAESESAADVRCRDGRIVEVGADLAVEGAKVVDAGGQQVLPGGVDPHVHMALPVAGTVSSDDFESGTTAAIAGGTTTILDFVHPERGEDFLEALGSRQREAERAVADYGFHMAVTWWGEDSSQAVAACVKAGVPSFKIYLAYKETVGLDDQEIVQVLAAAAQVDGLVLVHAEHGEMVEHLRSQLAAAGELDPTAHPRSRPSALEGEATNRAATLAGAVDAKLYVVHVTCREAVEAIVRAQRAGWPVHGETCPQYLLLDESAYAKPDFEGANYVISPPLRPPDHAPRLWDALADGTLEVVGTDHCPFTMEQKRLGLDDFRRIPGGAAGVEHRLSLLYTHGVVTGRMTPSQFVNLVSSRPAQLFGLYPRKGCITVGADADLVVWDPEATATISAATHHHNTDRSLYEGFTVQGAATTVVAGGRIVLDSSGLSVEAGAGQFLDRRMA